MRVCKHRCDVKMFCFSWANHVIKHEFDKQLCQFFFTKADILSEKNPYFGKHFFAKQELITSARLCVQDFGTGKNFCFISTITKSFLGKVIL